MLLSAVAICLIAPGVSAADYFPLKTGMKWSYEVSGDAVGAYEVQVTTPADINGTSTPQVLVMTQGKVTQHVFYGVDSSTVSVIGTDPKKPFSKPQPVFQIGDKPTKWDFTGDSPYEDDKGAMILISGSAKTIGTRDVLGTRRDCIEVKTETRIGYNQAASTLFKQTSVYAKGVGLIQVQEVSQSGRQTIKKNTKLTKFETAEAGS